MNEEMLTLKETAAELKITPPRRYAIFVKPGGLPFRG
jgi:hypothetical protein